MITPNGGGYTYNDYRSEKLIILAKVEVSAIVCEIKNKSNYLDKKLNSISMQLDYYRQ